MQERTGYSLTPAAMGQMQVHDVGVTAQDGLGRAGASSAAAMGGVLGAFEKMQDYRALSKANLDARGIQNDMEADFGQRMQAAPGTALSFMNEDGTLNREKVDGFAQEYKEKFAAVRPSFWDLKRHNEWEVERDEIVQNAMKRMAGQAQLHELAAIKRTGEAALAECELNDDAAGYAHEIRRQVDAGVLTEQEGRVKMLRFGKSRLRRVAGGGGGVRIGGQEFSGLGAAYAAQAAHEGYKVGEDAVQQAAPSGDFTLGGVPEEVSLKGTVGTETEVATPGVQGDYTLDADRMRAAMAPRGDDWLKMGDFSEVLKACNQQERMELQGLWDESYAVKAQELPDGSVRYDAGAGAPDAVELVAASGNVDGVPNKDAVEAMVGHVLVAELARDSGLNESDLVKTFDKSGAARVLGDGDEEVGKNIISGMAKEAKERSSGGREKMSTQDIDALVDMQVGDRWHGISEEVARERQMMEGLGEVDGKWEKPKDKEGHDRWMNMFNVYKKYRDRFYANHPEGNPDKKEFAEKAASFSKWYAKNVGTELKEAEKKAARDWYKAAALQRLMELRDSGNEVGYADELGAVREVLESRCPLAPAVERMMNERQVLYTRAKKQNEKRLNGAKPYYEQLLEMKGYEKEHSEAAQKAAAREEDKQRRADARAEEARLKAQQKREDLRRRVELQVPKVGKWGWNSQPVQGEKIPQCQVPKDEYERLVRLGYDGTQRVYMKVGTKEVLVDMSAPAPGGVVLMNAPACEYMQPPKPRGKRQAPKVLQGDTDYYFIFKN